MRERAALLLDAAGTLLTPAEPIAETYARAAQRHGGTLDASAVAPRFRAAMRRHRALRAGDPTWRGFWRAVVADATEVRRAAQLEPLLTWLYEHFAHAGAWRLAAGAPACCRAARAGGLKVAVVSNWDIRLRALLGELSAQAWIDAVVISGEHEFEKPDPRMFELACARLGVAPGDALHVGDSRRADVEGARAAGCDSWLFGHDVRDFDELRARLLARP